MRKYLLIGLLFTVLHSISQPGGSLVPGFGSFGVAASTTHSLYEKVVVQPDGKVVVISVHPQFFSNCGAVLSTTVTIAVQEDILSELSFTVRFTSLGPTLLQSNDDLLSW